MLPKCYSMIPECMFEIKDSPFLTFLEKKIEDNIVNSHLHQLQRVNISLLYIICYFTRSVTQKQKKQF